MNIIDQKTEIINWIDKLRDEDILKDILYKNQMITQHLFLK